MTDAKDIAECIADSAHLRTLVGAMFANNVRIVFTKADAPHGVLWAAIVVQGVGESEMLSQVARMVAERLDQIREEERGSAASN